MVKINLIDNWIIKSDKYQYKLVKIKGKREFTEGNYLTLENCVQACIEMKLRSIDANTISDLLESIKAVKTELNKALQPLKLEVISISENKERNFELREFIK